MPRRHELHLQDADPVSVDAMGRAIRDAVAHLEAALGDVAYNIGFHTAPHEHSGQYHWHVHLLAEPRDAAGFERGTGVMINVTPPERGGGDAAATPAAPQRDTRSVSAPTTKPRPPRCGGSSSRSSRTSTGWPTPS